MPATTPAIEDYLKTIYAHTEWQPEPITPSALAGKLGIAPSSVTEMVKKLAAMGMVTHVPYGAVRLNEAGTARALQVVRRHRLIETWLVNEMGYTWDAVHDEAEVLEHALSERLLAAIDARLGHPRRDPHGDPIPAADGSLQRPAAVLLAEAVAGHRGAVVRISDRDPAVLRLLTDNGIGLDTALELADAGVLLPDGRLLPLSAEALASIWVSA
ncbi:metal-dependent transcriptional regulator [Microterricola viridarii]|uniref:Manganese transport regulator n=1 Tax=Microterricola viridarii TaxID=412690 RepID=A0A1H1NGM4_9MICO|nr:metal-dependent transcriptional regulator [Microterricola viridarii]SDR97915.1 iron (metal) dependent repressor, DtxR family [Microterricola viridarii]